MSVKWNIYIFFNLDCSVLLSKAPDCAELIARMLCLHAGEAALRGESRMQPMSSTVNNHRTAPPPISPSKRKHSIELNDDSMDPNSEHVAKMSRLFATHLYVQSVSILCWCSRCFKNPIHTSTCSQVSKPYKHYYFQSILHDI